MNESKSMLEVWEWKEAVYNDTKDMTPEQLVKYYSESTEKFLKEMGYEKKMVGKNIYKLVKAS
jgi:hypothetical protein